MVGLPVQIGAVVHRHLGTGFGAFQEFGHTVGDACQ
jgi:hypothetical protein